MRASGIAMCLASGAAFGAMAVFGKLAYDEGSNVATLLTVRFALAAPLFWLLVLAGGTGSGLRTIARRDVLLALALGACGYSIQAGLFFSALERMDASLLSLVLYTFPTMVAVAAVLLGRERPDLRRFIALGCASGGLALVLAGAGIGTLDLVGVGLGLGAALVYTAYILTSQGVASRVRPVLLAALVCTGAALTLAIGSSVLGQLRLGDLSATGWTWLAVLAIVSTVAAVGLFFAGLRRVGPTAAAILSTVEPVITVVLAFLVFGESLAPMQVLGGALVLAAVLVLALRAAPARTGREVRSGTPGIDLPTDAREGARAPALG